MERVGFAVADVVISTNGSLRDIAIQRGGMRPEDVFVVRNGPDDDQFTRVAPDPALKRGKPHLLAYAGLMARRTGSRTRCGHLPPWPPGAGTGTRSSWVTVRSSRTCDSSRRASASSTSSSFQAGSLESRCGVWCPPPLCASRQTQDARERRLDADQDP